MVDLSIIIVSWNVASLLRACLRSILAGGRLDDAGVLHLGPYTAEIYVVDNASADGSAELVRREFPQAKLLANPTNVGFTAGNNQALRLCAGRYVLLLNPDTEIVGAALSVMLDYMERHAEVGVVGPQLRYGDGRLQSSRRRFPTFLTALMESTLLHQWFPRNPWAQRYYLADAPDEATQEVDWVVGACMLVRREAIQQVGLLDEDFFMYSEELDWCRRMTRAGWRVVYLPTAVVIHHEGQSSQQVVAARHIHFHTSKVLYFRKHHGRLPAEVLRLFLLGTYLFQWLEEGVKYLLGHRRALRRKRLAAYGQVLRSGLRPPKRASEGASHA